MRLVDLLAAVQTREGLQHLTYNDLVAFVHRASLLKDDILQPQPSTVPIGVAPDVLPPSITDFLADTTGISSAAMDSVWDVLKDVVWDLPTSSHRQAEEDALYALHGHKRGITKHVLYPPYKHCVNPDCISWQREALMKKEESREVVVFTHADGPHPAWALHLYCRTCCTNYHHNYSVKGGRRMYYSKIADYIQVGEHQFVALDLAKHWIDLMQIAISATNCAQLYEIELSRREEAGMVCRFRNRLTTEQVWDAFVIVTLLEDCAGRGVRLEVTHEGAQKDRFRDAMVERNNRIVTHGQEELPHTCSRCMRVWTMSDGTMCRTEVIVTDGVTVGHPCCGVPRCKEPLVSNRDRFCVSHTSLQNVCAVSGCDRPVMTKSGAAKASKACDDPAHRQMEVLSKESSAGLFQGRGRSLRPNVAQMDDATSSAIEPAVSSQVQLEEVEEWYEQDTRSGAVRLVRVAKNTSTGQSDATILRNDEMFTTTIVTTTTPPSSDATAREGCPTKSPDGNRKLKAQFGRRRTHNEQLIVRPCGVISARATFYNAEAVSNVLLMVEKVFSLPRARKPQHMIYDSNCNALQEVESRNLEFFKGMGMCVDAFHLRTKHKATDTFCRQRCDMRHYPELLDENGDYYFNSSIAEQTNVWFGGFHNICREMHPEKYNFFLDEMIIRRNRATVAKLSSKGMYPHHPPV